MIGLVALAIFTTALLAVHGYVMSEGRVWVGIAQPLVFWAAVSLAYWSMAGAV